MSNLYKRTANLLETITKNEKALLNHEKDIINSAASILNVIADKQNVQDKIERYVLDKEAMERAKAATN